MDLSSHAYTLLDLAAAGVIGFVAGRIVAGRSDPRRDEARKRQERDAGRVIDHNLARLSAEARAAVTQHLAQGRYIEAVKDCRSATGLGLKESKDLVDRLNAKTGH